MFILKFLAPVTGPRQEAHRYPLALPKFKPWQEPSSSPVVSDFNPLTQVTCDAGRT